jgi:F-type H+-transporting ATPase subunit delta
LNGAVATRYAAALADVAFERKNGEAVKRDLSSFVKVFFSSADLRIFLESPAVSAEAKHGAIEKITEKMALDPAVRNFVYLVVDHRRTELLGEIERAFGAELNARLGIAEAEITSARPLSAAEKKELTSVLERRTGKKIEARFEEDAALLGGATVRVGSTIYDGSVREQLTRLREQLEGE